VRKDCEECGKYECSPHRKICSHCIYLKRKERDPQRVAYTNLKAHAKVRGKEFSLTLEEFRQFCIKTLYLNNSGTGRDSYHIDRIDETRGYTADNIQCITNVQNVKKYIAFVQRTERGIEFTTKIVRHQDEDIAPF